MENTILLIGQIVLFVIVTFTLIYIKQLPKTFQEKALKYFQHSLNEKLEMLKITQTELQTLKRNEFIRYSEYWRKTFENQKLISNPKHVNELNSIGLNFFFFASDEVVKKFVELRKLLLYTDTADTTYKKKALIKMAELNLLMRKDLGYQETKCDEDDYLNILLKDWEIVKNKENIYDRQIRVFAEYQHVMLCFFNKIHKKG